MQMPQLKVSYDLHVKQVLISEWGKIEIFTNRIRLDYGFLMLRRFTGGSILELDGECQVYHGVRIYLTVLESKPFSYLTGTGDIWIKDELGYGNMCGHTR